MIRHHAAAGPGSGRFLRWFQTGSLWGCIAQAGGALALGACGDSAGGGGHLPEAKAPDNAVGGFAIELPAITLQPGEEQEPCYVLPLTLNGPSRLVSAAVLTTQPGMHHGNITSRAKTGDGVRTCPPSGMGDVAAEIFSGGTVLFASSTQVRDTEWQSFPDGMAIRIPEDQEIVARMHYLNASPQPLTIAPRYQWFTIAESDLKQRLAPFAWAYTDFQIPPRSQFTVRADCPLSRPMYMVQALPHMHALGRRLTIGFSGGPQDSQLVLDNDTYGTRGESDIRQWNPAIDLSQGGLGSGFRFSCSWDNTFDKVIENGIGDNEMCIVFGYAYPPENTVSAAVSETVDCVSLAPQHP